MKKGTSNIILALSIIFVVLLSVWFFAYLPKFGNTISGNSVDWSGFGDFFWGLGTMLFTGLSVWMLYFVNQQLRENQEQQQIQQEKFQTQLEESRRKFLEEIIRRKRIEDWLETYHQIVLKLTGSELKSDADWLNLLRELTVTYKAIIAEQNCFAPDTLDKINKVNGEIKDVILKSYSVVNSSVEGLKIAILYVSLNKEIVDLYFELLTLNKVSFDIDFLFKEEKDEKQKRSMKNSKLS